MNLFVLAMMAPAKSTGEKGIIFACFPHAYGAWQAWMDCVVIRIRYKDFSAGTHDMAGLYGMAERRPRGVTVYLLPGLAVGQRRAVIRRLRQEASRGFGPPLPQPQLAIALGLDRVRMTARVVKAVVRLHPAVTLVPGAVVVAMVTLFVIAAGDRAGLMPGPQGGLANAVAAGGGAHRAASAGPGHARMARATSAAGAGGTAAGGFGLGSAERALVSVAREARPGGKPPVSAPVQQGPWYTCPKPVTAASRSREAQLTCHRAAPRAVPHTAHLPGPLDFAW
jgi:hypothetical protein